MQLLVSFANYESYHSNKEQFDSHKFYISVTDIFPIKKRVDFDYLVNSNRILFLSLRMRCKSGNKPYFSRYKYEVC